MVFSSVTLVKPISLVDSLQTLAPAFFAMTQNTDRTERKHVEQVHMSRAKRPIHMPAQVVARAWATKEWNVADSWDYIIKRLFNYEATNLT